MDHVPDRRPVPGDPWRLTEADHALVAAKPKRARLEFAMLLLFFRAHGRFPRTLAEGAPMQLTRVARQLGLVPRMPGRDAIPGRTFKRYRAEIRALFGTRQATVHDAQDLVGWLRDHAVATTRDIASLAGQLDARCRALGLEPPSAGRAQRIARSAVQAHDEQFCARIHGRLPAAALTRLDELLRPSRADEGAETAAASVVRLRSDPGRPSLASLRKEMAKLETLRGLALPAGLFDGVPPREVKRWHQRVAVEAPYELRRHAEPLRLTSLAAFAHLRMRTITDDLVHLLIDTIHQIGARAERRVERELIEGLKRVTGKPALLFDIAEASLANPEGAVRDVVFPVAGEQTLRDLVRERKATGSGYRTSLRTVIRSSYSGHYRRAVPDLLETLEFRSNNALHRPVIDALALVRRYARSKIRTFPADETVPLDGVVRGLWREAVIETEPQGRPRINRITYEICVLEALRERLRCKEIWVVGADRYRNPDEDLPADFEARRSAHYDALNLSLDPDRFIAGLRADMAAALRALDEGLPHDPSVRISRKAGGWITVAPLERQPEPTSLTALKAAIGQAWPMTRLLDVLKETDLRLDFTSALKSPTAREALGRAVLRPRLLLCLHGLGTNTGLRRMVGLGDASTYKDLLYARQRFITAEGLRRAIAIVTNGTLKARNPLIWGDGTTACASDSKHFGAWDQNLMTQWHVRYGGRGVMIYWHVERKSLCIHSQLKSPSSSEVASMIEGVIRHCTEMAIDRQYVDSHGQSEVAFAFCRLLGFQLLPRLRRIHKQRLYRPEAGRPDDYPHLQPVLTRPIDWDLIRRQYDEMVKYATALRLGTAETEAILRRFTRANVQHPTYKALAELGKAVKTVFLCRYLSGLPLRREIHEGLNVIEQWNSANDLVFFARKGELASNRRDDHVVSMLALHLLQNAMVYINTLMIQQTLAQPDWASRLTGADRRAITPLIWEHINPYGRFDLDMTARLALA
jgi:TnpA family transposase